MNLEPNTLIQLTGGQPIEFVLANGYRHFHSCTKGTGNDTWLIDHTPIEDYLGVFGLTQSDIQSHNCLDFMGRGLDPHGICNSITSVGLSGGHNKQNTTPTTEVVGDIFRTKVWKQLQEDGIKKGGFDFIFYVPHGGHYLGDGFITNQEEFNAMLGILLVRLRIIEKLQKLLSDDGVICMECPIVGLDLSTLPNQPINGHTTWEVLRYLYEGLNIEDEKIPMEPFNKFRIIRQHENIRAMIWKLVRPKLGYIHSRLNKGKLIKIFYF